MDKKLHLLDSFPAQGSDGKAYKVCGYEHMVRAERAVDGLEHWEPTGVVEYRLADGQRVTVQADGTMVLSGSDVRLTKSETSQA